MANLLYPDFLQNPASYDAAELLWKQFFDTLSTKNGISYQPYINIFLSNGEKERDGNPIFSALVSELNRGVRIIQYPVEDVQELYISGWLNVFGMDEDEPGIHELVIALVLSKESMAIAENWINAWLIDQAAETTVDQMIEAQMVLVN